MKIDFQVNGSPASVEVDPMRRLLDVLREELRLTGSKEGCGEGECGACTVLIDGRAVCSCLVPMVQVADTAICTIEGLGDDKRLHPLQQAFIDHGATQCGICTPGFLVTAAELLTRKSPVNRQTLREALAGNLCRCTGYQKIIEATAEVLSADE